MCVCVFVSFVIFFFVDIYKYLYSIPYTLILYFPIVCDSTWEKGPSHVFLQDRVIATIVKSRL